MPEPEPEPAYMEEPVAEKQRLDEFVVDEPDVVQKELLQAVEEIAENPTLAPQEAHAEETVAPIETYGETHQVSMHIVKENLPEASSNEGEREQ
jgi:hypothetical protein